MQFRSFTIITLMVSSCVAGLAGTITVEATADIYSAGYTRLADAIYPVPFASSVGFQSEPNRVLTFSSATGVVGCNLVLTNEPDRKCFPGVSTTAKSCDGLSGISVDDDNMFFVSALRDDAEPTDPVPLVLAYNYRAPNGLTTSDASFASLRDQMFFIGDGLTGANAGQERVCDVSGDATELYLGFADFFDSVPSYHADNVVSLDATLQISNAAPEPSTLCLLGAGLIAIGLISRRKILLWASR